MGALEYPKKISRNDNKEELYFYFIRIYLLYALLNEDGDDMTTSIISSLWLVTLYHLALCDGNMIVICVKSCYVKCVKH